MLTDELDIYDDLDDFQQAEDAKSKELQSWEAKCDAKQVEVINLHAQIKAFEKKIKTMEVNFQNLLDTAKAEIKRKDALITQLRKEKDDICFRRKRTNNAEQFEPKPLNADQRQEHKHFNPFGGAKSTVSLDVANKGGKRNKEIKANKQPVAGYEKSTYLKRDKQSSSEATSSRHRSTDGRRNYEKDKDRVRHHSRSRSRNGNRERCRSQEEEQRSSKSNHTKTTKTLELHRDHRSRTSYKSTNKSCNESQSVTNEKRNELKAFESLFGNTPMRNIASPTEMSNEPESSVDSIKVLERMLANADPLTPVELYTPLNEAGNMAIIDVAPTCLEQIVEEVDNYFVSNATKIEQIKEILEAEVQMKAVEKQKDKYIPGLDSITKEEMRHEQIDVEPAKQTVEEHTKIQSDVDRFELFFIDNDTAEFNLTESTVDVLTENEDKAMYDVESIEVKIKKTGEEKDNMNIEHTVNEIKNKESTFENAKTESDNESQQPVHESHNKERALENIKLNYATVKDAEKNNATACISPKSPELTAQYTESHSENSLVLSKRHDIQIIEDIRLPVMMDIEHIAVIVDAISNSPKKDTKHSNDPLISADKLKTDIDEEMLKQLFCDKEPALSAAPPLDSQIVEALLQDFPVNKNDIISNAVAIPTETTIRYAQPDSTKVDHPDALETAINVLIPQEPVPTTLDVSYPNLSLETDTIELALEQLHQQSHSDNQPDETAVTSTSMKTPHTPKHDLIKILTQSPMHQSAADKPYHSPTKTKVKAKKAGVRRASDNTRNISENDCTVTPERLEITPLKKRKLNLAGENTVDNEVPLTPPNNSMSTTANSQLAVTINETLNSSILEQSHRFSSDSSIVTKRCSLGNSDYQFERINNEVILRVTRHGRRRRAAAPAPEN